MWWYAIACGIAHRYSNRISKIYACWASMTWLFLCCKSFVKFSFTKKIKFINMQCMQIFTFFNLFYSNCQMHPEVTISISLVNLTFNHRNQHEITFKKVSLLYSISCGSRLVIQLCRRYVFDNWSNAEKTIDFDWMTKTEMLTFICEVCK